MPGTDYTLQIAGRLGWGWCGQYQFTNHYKSRWSEMFWLLVGGTWHQNVCDVILACHAGRIMGVLNTECQSFIIWFAKTEIEMSGYARSLSASCDDP